MDFGVFASFEARMAECCHSNFLEGRGWTWRAACPEIRSEMRHRHIEIFCEFDCSAKKICVEYFPIFAGCTADLEKIKNNYWKSCPEHPHDVILMSLPQCLYLIVSWKVKESTSEF